MNLLQFIVIISGFFFFLLSIDAYKRKKLNFIHFFSFFLGTLVIIIFVFNINLLNKFGAFFGLTRGADLIVYSSIVLYGFFYFELMHKVVKNSNTISRLLTQISIKEFKGIDKKIIENIKKESPKFYKYAILMRLYNEETVLENTLESVIKKGFKKIIIVNDGSSDNSLKIAQNFQEKNKKSIIIILSHLINRGGGSANKTGFEFLKQHGDELDIDYAITFDADGQMSIDDMDTFINEIQKDKGKIDAYLGSRFLQGGVAKNIPLSRSIILFGSRIITFIFNKVWTTDPHNGYRVLSLNLIKKIKIESDGMTYASELLDEIKNKGFKWKEIPVNIIYTQYSLNKGQKNSNALNILFEIIYKKFFFR